MFRRTVTEDEVAVTPEALVELCSDVKLKVYDAFTVDGSPVHLSVMSNLVYATIEIKSLPLKAPYQSDGGILTPDFMNHSGPIMDLAWHVPSDMRLLFMASIEPGKKSARITDQWLFAMDTDERCYRLPLGNLYADARLCNGEFNLNHKTVMAAVEAELAQFKSGQWNSDLSVPKDETNALFRFRATSDGFEQLAPLKPWTECSPKINPAVIKHLCL